METSKANGTDPPSFIAHPISFLTLTTTQKKKNTPQLTPKTEEGKVQTGVVASLASKFDTLEMMSPGNSRKPKLARTQAMKTISAEDILESDLNSLAATTLEGTGSRRAKRRSLPKDDNRVSIQLDFAQIINTSLKSESGLFFPTALASPSVAQSQILFSAASDDLALQSRKRSSWDQQKPSALPNLNNNSPPLSRPAAPLESSQMTPPRSHPLYTTPLSSGVQPLSSAPTPSSNQSADSRSPRRAIVSAQILSNPHHSHNYNNNPLSASVSLPKIGRAHV